MINNLIFDMDGVLVDSERAITLASIEALRFWGIEAKEEDFKPFTGMGEDMFVGGVARKYGKAFEAEMKQKAYELYIKTAKDRVLVFPDTLELLKALNALGIPLALASAADREKVLCNIDCIGISPEIFKVIVTGSDVKNKKPDPEIFLAAAKKASFNPQETLVVEDALSGVKAAKSAGMSCLAVTTSFDKRALSEVGADFVVEKLGDLMNIIERAR